MKLRVGRSRESALAGAAGARSASGESGGFSCLALAKLFHASFVSFATEHPPQDVIEASRVLRASAQLADGDEVALLQGNDQLAPPPTVSVFVNCHAEYSLV